VANGFETVGLYAPSAVGVLIVRRQPRCERMRFDGASLHFQVQKDGLRIADKPFWMTYGLVEQIIAFLHRTWVDLIFLRFLKDQSDGKYESEDVSSDKLVEIQRDVGQSRLGHALI
jgi:hypothetical protein